MHGLSDAAAFVGFQRGWDGSVVEDRPLGPPNLRVSLAGQPEGDSGSVPAGSLFVPGSALAEKQLVRMERKFLGAPFPPIGPSLLQVWRS